MNNRLIKSNDAGGGGCTNTVDLYNPFPDGGGVALYQLNGDATDVSGNYDGTASNVTYGTGQFDQSGVFNGSTSGINLGNGLVSSLTALSTSAWFNTDNISLNAQILLDLGFSSTGNGLQIFIQSGGNIVYRVNSGGSNVFQEIINGVISNNTWYNITATFENTTSGAYKLYLNNSLIASGNSSQTGSISFASTGLYLGHYNQTFSRFDGSIDQVRIFSRALRPYEVEALYTEEYCTPTIVPSEHFSVNVWDGGTIQSINTGFQPDLVWIKSMDVANNHNLADSVRGIDKILYSNLTNSEAERLNSIETTSTGYNLLDTWAGRNSASYNRYVGWSFKAGGAAVTNTDGAITSQVSANTEAGFSVVKWTGNGSTNATVGHGLGNTPIITIRKRLNSSSIWAVIYNNSFTGATAGTGNGTHFIPLNTTDAEQDASQFPQNDTTFDTYFTYDNANGAEFIAYCFAEVEGFSNFGSYVGTDTRQGIVTGFEPAFVMIKRTDTANAWFMIDNQRFATNKYDRYLRPEVTDAQGGLNSAQYVEFYENGFSVETGSGLNGSGGKYIYMAFAADPTTIEPSLEDSFNTVTYTGNGGTQSVTGVGFEPDLVWVKSRDVSANAHVLQDTVRGAGQSKTLHSNFTINEGAYGNYGFISSFDSDGFGVSIGSTSAEHTNFAGEDYVAWNWKGAELPAINSNGSIPSVVSANPAAGFSIVSCTATGGVDTIGHGLGVAPSVIIYKTRSTTGNWSTYHQSLGNTRGVYLNLTSAAVTSQFFWNNTSPTSDVFTAYGSAGNTHIAYCFAEVAGFSKFGSYNGSSSDVYVSTGFEPAFVVVKSLTGSYSWYMIDNKRGATSPTSNSLFANLGNAEAGGYGIYFDSTGFTVSSGVGTGTNSSGNTYAYMAFANQF